MVVSRFRSEAEAAALLAFKRNRLGWTREKDPTRLEAVIIDDIGYAQQTRVEMEMLFTLLAYRYERGSVMVASNLPFSGWEQILKDPTTTAAAIDSLVHHCVVFELNVKSLRMEQAQKKTVRNPEEFVKP